jgi:hypothetical protein
MEPTPDLNLDVWKIIFNLIEPLDLLMLPYVSRQLYNYMKLYIPHILQFEYISQYLTSSTHKNVAFQILEQRAKEAKLNLSYNRIYMLAINTHYWTSIEGLVLKFVNYPTVVLYGPCTHIRKLLNNPLITNDMEREMFIAAVLSGEIKKLKLVHRNHSTNCQQVCKMAAAQGNLEMLQWARQHKKWMQNHVCLWDADTVAEAAKNGHKNVLEWCLSNGCPWDFRIKTYAQMYGHSHLLPLVEKYTFDKTDPTMFATKANDTNLLKWCLEKGYEWNSVMCKYAIEHGFYDVVQMVHQMGYSINSDICEVAAAYGHLDVLQWAYLKGFTLDPDQIIYVASDNCFKKCIANARSDDINKMFVSNCNQIVKIYEEVFEWVKYTLLLEPEARMFEWHMSHGGKWTEIWCNFALVTGNLELLKWAFHHHLSILPILCITIAGISREIVPANKLLEMMKWFHSVGFNLNTLVCKKAGEHRDYQMLRWAVDNGCSIRFEDHIGWDIPSLYCLTYRQELYVESNVEFLKWLISHKFCWDRKAKQLAFDVEMYELLGWAKTNGY